MSISAAEFEALQLQLIELKEAKYESQDREKKFLHGMFPPPVFKVLHLLISPRQSIITIP
jgi:hypothetical protein